jgi:hypothetical protein
VAMVQGPCSGPVAIAVAAELLVAAYVVEPADADSGQVPLVVGHVQALGRLEHLCRGHPLSCLAGKV